MVVRLKAWEQRGRVQSSVQNLLFHHSSHNHTVVALKAWAESSRTAKYAFTLCMWLRMKWHGAWLYGVHRTRRDGSSFMWRQPMSHASTVSTPLWWIFKNALWKAIHLCRITCEHSESAQEHRTALYKSDQQQHTARCRTLYSTIHHRTTWWSDWKCGWKEAHTYSSVQWNDRANTIINEAVSPHNTLSRLPKSKILHFIPR